MSGAITVGYVVGDDGAETLAPIRFGRDELASGHIHVRGRTRSGKSSLFLLGLALQLMESEEEGKVPDPVVIIDLGGDQAMFHATRSAAMSAGRRFRFVALSSDPEVDWDYLDPFEFFGSQGPMRQATALLEALNLDPGLVMDRMYFAAQNVGAVLTPLKAFESEGRKPTLREVAERLDTRTYRDAHQIWMSLQFLLEYPQISPPEGTDPDRVVSFARALERGEVVYFYVPTMNEATTARSLAGLGLRNLIQAAIERTDRGMPTRRVWVIADEFQEVTGKSFAAVLAQTAKHGITVVMANQTTDQLKNHDAKLSSVVRDNTHVKAYFTVVGEEDIKDLQSYSGEDVEILEGGWSASLGRSSTTGSARKDFELSRDEILDTSSTFGHAFLIADEGKGYTLPRRIWMRHRIAPEVFRVIRRKPLPRRKQLIALPGPTRRPPDTPQPDSPRTDASKPASLLRMIERKRAAEGFDEPAIL